MSLGSAATADNAATTDASSVKTIPDAGTLAISRTQEATQIDEIFNALDKQTRVAFQRWIQNAVVGIKGRGLDLNDAFGRPRPVRNRCLAHPARPPQPAIRRAGLVRDTGTVFDALSAQDGGLSRAITGSDTPSRRSPPSTRRSAQAFQIFPTFEHERHRTLARLDRFRTNAHPLVRKLLPVVNDVSPTLRYVRQLSPHLRSLFIDLKPLIRVSVKGLPATARFLGGVRPVLGALDPFLANVEPVVNFFRAYRTDVTNFLSNPGVGFGQVPPVPNQPAPGMALRILSYISPETLSIYQNRLPTNRGNAYGPPNSILVQGSAKKGIFPNFDCKNLNFTPVAGPSGPVSEHPLVAGQSKQGINNGNPPGVGFAPCFIQKKLASFGNGRYPRLYAQP